MILLVITLLIIIITVGYFWATGIDNMKENYPEYKGEDFLNWDDNKTHTESDF